MNGKQEKEEEEEKNRRKQSLASYGVTVHADVDSLFTCCTAIYSVHSTKCSVACFTFS